LGYANRGAIRASFRELPNDHSDIGAMATVPTEAELHTRKDLGLRYRGCVESRSDGCGSVPMTGAQAGANLCLCR